MADFNRGLTSAYTREPPVVSEPTTVFKELPDREFSLIRISVDTGDCLLVRPTRPP